jgi:hypothetical protein
LSFREAFTTGFRFLWTIAAHLDAAADQLTESLNAWFPGRGTPTALSLTGRTRGIIRGRNETDAAYAERLRAWWDKWEKAGGQEAIARAVSEYLNSPGTTVRVVNRNGEWLVLNPDGSIDRYSGLPIDWDSVDHPERVTWWSEQWVIVSPDPWAHDVGTWGDGGTWGDDGFGFYHFVPTSENDALRGQIAQWKSAHSYVRALIFTNDGTFLNPLFGGGGDGTWGDWGRLLTPLTTPAGMHDYVASGRPLNSERYWEFEDPPFG